MPARPQLPEDLKQLLAVVQEGKLLVLQEWIAASKRLRATEVDDYRARVLRVDVETGLSPTICILPTGFPAKALLLNHPKKSP